MYIRRSLLLGLLTSSAFHPAFAQTAAPAQAQPVAPAVPASQATGQVSGDASVSSAPPQTDAATPAAPQASNPEADAGEEEEEAIVITGQRERGSVPGNIPPEIQLNSRDIRAYGASNLSELLDDLAPQTQSGRGRGDGSPVILLNGRRISSFREIRDLPPEAVTRIDILPEEAALKLGYRADQRVVNFVLRRHFRTITAEASGGLSTEGDRGSYGVNPTLVRIDEDRRLTIDGKYQHQAPLYESQRRILQADEARPYAAQGNVTAAAFGEEVDPALSAMLGEPVTAAGVPASALSGAPSLADFSSSLNTTDLRPFRTLLPATDQASINTTLSRSLGGTATGTVNLSYEQSNSESAFGLPSGALDIPAGNPFSPFTNDVTLYRSFDGLHPLQRNSDSGTAHAGLSLNGDLSRWRWSVTANYDRVRTVARTDTDLDVDGIQDRITSGDTGFNPFGPLAADQLTFLARERTRSLNQSGDAELVLNGPLFSLPAGDVVTSFKMGAEVRGFDSMSNRGGFDQDRSFSRRDVNGQVNLDLPIASRSRAVLGAIGDLSLNGNVAVDDLSDFGTLTTFGYGVNWSPIRPLRLIASVTDEQGAPTVQQLGDPLTLVPNVRVFDFVRGETVDITRIEGGNADLRADHRRVFKLGATLKPLSETDLTITANYIKTRIRNSIASFPTATPEIEAAFPERFVRHEDGTLLSIDARPVNFARANTAQLRWGVTFSKPIASRNPWAGMRGAGGPGGPGAPGGWGGWRGRGEGGRRDGDQTAQAAASSQGATAAGQGDTAATAPAQSNGTPPAVPNTAPAPERRQWGGGEGRGFGGAGGRRQGGRLQFSLYHTWHFQDEVLIRPGVPELDFLNGSARGSGGGAPRHEVEAQAGIFKNGFGARLIGNWQSGTTVNGDTAFGSGWNGRLTFSSLAKVKMRLFAELGQQPALVSKHPWLRGTRLSLNVDNLFNSRVRVRDAAGNTPLSYQPDYLDPLGRSVRLTIRKMFF